MSFTPLADILKDEHHHFYRIYYLPDAYTGYKEYRQVFWNEEAALKKADEMSRKRKYGTVRVSVVNETIIR